VGGVNTFERRHPGGMLHLQTTGWRKYGSTKGGVGYSKRRYFFVFILFRARKNNAVQPKPSTRETFLFSEVCLRANSSQSIVRVVVQSRMNEWKIVETCGCRNQNASTSSRLSREFIRKPNPSMAWRLILVAKFLGPSSSAPEGGPRGCLEGWLTIL